jgi:DNA-binding transcriptional MerR regulator
MEPLAGKERVAEILGIEPRTLDNWASAGKGPVYVKVGGHRMYDLADVREWVEARKVTPSPAGKGSGR